jgi:UDP-glucuronate decarboxylase
MTDKFMTRDVSDIATGLGKSASAFAGKTIYITGGRGFLGRYFSETFAYLNAKVLDKPCRVIVADNLITAGKLGAESFNAPGFTFLQQDVTKKIQIDGPVDYILHAAGIASPYYYQANPLETIDVAISGTRNALEMAREKDARIVFFSSSEIYGDPDPKFVPTPETYKGSVAILGPRSCYDESKRLGETLCHVFHEKFGTKVCTVRPFNVYGPGMQEKDYRVLPNFAARIAAGKPLKVYGNGNQTRTFCYVSDAIAGFLLALVHGKPGQPYNIGNPTPEISMLQLAKEIQKVLGRDVALELVGYPEGYPGDEPNRRCPDICKARKELGYEARIDLSEGLRRFFEWTKTTYVGEA